MVKLDNGLSFSFPDNINCLLPNQMASSLLQEPELPCESLSLRSALYSHPKQGDSAWLYSASHAINLHLVLIFTTTFVPL